MGAGAKSINIHRDSRWSGKYGAHNEKTKVYLGIVKASWEGLNVQVRKLPEGANGFSNMLGKRAMVVATMKGINYLESKEVPEIFTLVEVLNMNDDKN